MKRAFLLLGILFSLFFLFVVAVANAQPVEGATPAIVSLPDWLSYNWTIVALAVSESMAFLPAKFSGIAKAIFSVISAIFGKRSSVKY